MSALPGDVETVIRQDAPQAIYRNPFLADAMVELNLIDTQGGGITGPAAALVEERGWHETQQIEWLNADNTLFEELPGEHAELIATFRLSDLVEFKRWLLGFGAAAEVLRPDSLRRELRDELSRAADRYRNQDSQ